LSILAGGAPRRFGDVAADFQLRDLAALSKALLALAAGGKPDKQRFWFERSKGASKDCDLAMALCWLLAFSPRALECQVGAADLEQASEIRKAVQTLLRLNLWLGELLAVQNWTIRNPATGSECGIISSDAPSAHGSRPDLAILNELSHVTKEDFAQTMMDNSAKIPHGIVCIATNAGFVGTWQWTWRELARQSERWVFSAYSRPAPWVDAAELVERERTSSKSRFRRLWWGEWVSALGDALDETDVAAMFSADVPQSDTAESGYAFVGGLDLSVSRDHSAFVAVGKHSSGRYRVARCWLWRPVAGGKVDLSQVESTIRDAHRAFRFRTVAADPFQAEYLCSRLSKAGVPIQPRPQTGKALVEQCCMLLEQINSRNLDSYRFEPLERDLRRLQVEEKSYGMRLVAPRDGNGHGDIMTALSIALAVGKSASTGADCAGFVPPMPGTDAGAEYEAMIAAQVAEWGSL
jgi:phage terminase large subunit-like protein